MKQIIVFSSLFVFSLFVSCGDSTDKTYKIEELGIEVIKEDFGGTMNWEEAKRACREFGLGWRLPTIDELEKMYELKDIIGGFKDNTYWSSTDFGGDGNGADAYDFRLGFGTRFYKSAGYYVRAVRDL